MSKYFLDIASSVTGHAWLDALDLEGNELAGRLQQQFGASSTVARLLAAQGVTEPQFYSYLDPKLRDLLPNPKSFKDMELALDCIIEAIEGKVKIAIYGDYDVDGACSAALMKLFLTHLGAECLIYIPQRLEEGYGLNNQAMQHLQQLGCGLVIAVDCGTNDGAAMQGISGLKLVVLDHHKVAKLNEHAIAIVNPSRPDDNSGCAQLCAAGVVFITLVGLATRLRARYKIPDLLGYLDLVALATICDLVPLIGVNRAFVVGGLKIARTLSNVGIKALAKAAMLVEPLNAYHFSYILGPSINAAGRIADASLGAQLLCCNSAQQAEEWALSLRETNKQRQQLETEAQTSLIFALHNKYEGRELAPALIEMGDWHAGLVGLLAGRLKDKYLRPVIILSKKPDGTAVGSARSIRGVDIGALIAQAVEAGLLLRGGGHAMAAGLTIEQDKLEAFSTWLCQQISEKIGQFHTQPILKITSLISARGATEELCREIEKAGPYGAGNMQPIFALRAHKIVYIKPMGSAHLTLTLQDNSEAKLKAIAFNVIDGPLGQFLLNNLGNNIHIAGNLRLNSYRNFSSPQLNIIDAAPAF